MIGIITPDNILYCGDAFFGDDTIDKHGLLFYTNIGDTIESLKKIQGLDEEQKKISLVGNKGMLLVKGLE